MQDHRPPKMSRLERARVIAQVVLDAHDRSGCWKVLEDHDGPSMMIRHVDIGAGWSASLDAGYFCAAQRGEEVELAEATGLDVPDFSGEVLISVWTREGGKVLSLYRDALGEEKLIGMRPGPWESLFGLSKRDWSPSVAKKVWHFPRAAA